MTKTGSERGGFPRSLADAPLDRIFDLLVIGGGIHGAAIARDAALRGYAVCVVDKHDWGWATSAKSSRLAHGGLRYLEQGDLGLVHEALQDRERFFRQSPHLVRPLRFLYPIYPDVPGARLIRVGLWIYDRLSHGKSVPNHARLSRQAVLEHSPLLEPNDLRGAAVFWDGQFPYVERLVMEWLEEATRHGAVAIAHAACTGFVETDGQVQGATVTQHGTTRTIRARAIINAAGPWLDQVLASPPDAPTIRLSKGVHIVVPRFVEDAYLIRSRRDGRAFFVLPHEDTCIIGTTDTAYHGDPGQAQASPEDVAYLQESTRRYFPKAPVHDIRYTYAGVRALVNQPGLPEGKVTRRHIVLDHATRGRAGLWSIQGGKITTSRSLAEAVVDAVQRWFGDKVRHATRQAQSLGGVADWAGFHVSARAQLVADGWVPAEADALVDRWGGRASDVAALAGSGRDHLARLAAELAFVHAHQGGYHFADVALRRLCLAQAWAFDTARLQELHTIMTKHCAWSPAQAETEWADFLAESMHYRTGILSHSQQNR